MSQAVALSRARARMRKGANSKVAKRNSKSVSVAKADDCSCRHCGRNLNRYGITMHEKHCHENTRNMKLRAKSGREHEDAKRNEKQKSASSSKTFSARSISRNEEIDCSKQYSAGAEYLLSLRANQSIRHMTQKYSSSINNTCSDEECFGDTNYDSYDECEESNICFDRECDVATQSGDTGLSAEYSSSDDASFTCEADAESSESDDDISMEDDTEFFKLPTKFQHATTLYDARKYKTPSRRKIHMASKRYKYRHKLNTTQVALVDLANILATRHKVDKKLFNCIASWARFHSNKDPKVWKSNGKANVWSRSKLLTHLEKTFYVKGLMPMTKEMETHDRRKVTVPIFDFAAQVRNLLDDPDVMNKDNIMKGLDQETWRPTLSAEEFEKDYHADIADKDSGYLYRMGIEAHVPDHEDNTKILPLPIIVHIDKSHYDLHSNLCVTPIGFTLGMLDIDTQQKVDSWKMMATVPNLSAKKGKNKKKKEGQTKRNIQDMHNVLRIAFSSLEKCWRRGGIVWRNIHNEAKILKPYIYMVIGDTVGNNELVAHFLGNTQGKCLVKDCKCCKDDLVKVPPKCTQMTYQDYKDCGGDDAKIFEELSKKNLISLKDLSDIKENEGLEHSISYYNVDNAFDHLPLADKYQGIVGITPQESLHVLEAGMYEHIPTTIRDIIGTNNKNQAVKESVDHLFTDVKSNLNRNSERDILRMSNRSGFFNLKKVNASERHGNFFALTLLMHTTHGANILKPEFEKHGINYEEMRETAALLLAWDRFILDYNERFQHDMAYKATLVLMRRIKRHFPRAKRAKSKEDGDGKMGWHIVKYHALLLLLANCRKFGCAGVFHGSASEKNHKYFVKRMASQTQMRLDSFATQVATNYYEYELFRLAYKYERHNCMPRNFVNSYDTEKTNDSRQDHDDLDNLSDCSSNDEGIDKSFERSKEARCRGSFTLEIKTNTRHHITSKFCWKYEEKQKLNNLHQPNPIIAKSLGLIAIRYAQTMKLSKNQTFMVECFTEVNVPIRSGGTTKDVLFRCSPLLHNSEWYDFAMIKLPMTKEKPNGDVCAARLISFLQYTEKSSLTFKKVECMNLNADEVRDTVDDTMYALVQCEVGNLKYEYIERHFVKKILLGPKDSLYIVPISSIVGKLLVIPNILDEGKVSEDQFLVAMGHHKWGKYFVNFSKEIDETYGENELSDEEDNLSDDEESNQSGSSESNDEDEESDEQSDEEEGSDSEESEGEPMEEEGSDYEEIVDDCDIDYW